MDSASRASSSPSRRQLLMVGAAALVAGAATAAPAERYVWRNVRVGGGGFVPGIVFSRVEKGLAYLRSDMGGLYRWDPPQGRWTPLQDSMWQSSYQGVESVAPDPLDADVVYAAVGMYRREPAAILRSADRGASWTITPVSFQMGGNEDGRGLGERLAVDPNKTSILYFASRHDGLQVSRDSGASWEKARNFPIKGRGVPAPGMPTNAGLSFVLFDQASSGRGEATRRIFVGSAEPGQAGLWTSDDAGHSWRRVEGWPRADLLAVKGEIDARGVVYITCANGAGPNSVTDGAVLRFDPKLGNWSDISPEKAEDKPAGGYMGISLDRSAPGVLVVASLNRWRPGDIVWRSTDDGKTWRNLREGSVRDVAATPFLLWGKPVADFGWWIAGLAVDPFDPQFVTYATGATIYVTRQVSAPATRWEPWVEGVEQTAVLALASPPAGPHLISGFGDIGGFAHEHLDRSPPIAADPIFTNTNSIEYAGQAAHVVVRSGTPHDDAARWARSDDFGRTWRPLRPPLPQEALALTVKGRTAHPYLDASIIVSADGAATMVLFPTPLLSHNGGRTWSAVQGLPAGLRPVADRQDADRFYAFDFHADLMWHSRDGGRTFTSSVRQGLPREMQADRPSWREDPWPLQAAPHRAGELWFVSRQGLFRSTDGGRSFAKAPPTLAVEQLSFGQSSTDRGYPSLFAIGSRDKQRAIWRSDDIAKTWVRLNDSAHEYGRRFRCISGDPRVFGRVYVGTDGRGILYGDLA